MSQSAGCQHCEKEYSHVGTHTLIETHGPIKEKHAAVSVRGENRSNAAWGVEEKVESFKKIIN